MEENYSYDLYLYPNLAPKGILEEMFMESGKWVRHLKFWSPWWHYLQPYLTLSNSSFCPQSVFMCFVWIWEKTAIISLYRIYWLDFIIETEFVYCAVRTGSLYTSSLTFSNSTFCPHSVFVCFVWIWEQTVIISLYNINWLVFIIETECLLRGTDWIFIYRQFNVQQFYVLPTQCICVFCADLRTNSDYFPI